MPLPIGTKVKSIYGKSGTIVGWGALKWPQPQTPDTTYGDEAPRLVYLVQVAEGSNAEGQACVVMRADCVKEVTPDDGMPNNKFTEIRETNLQD